MIFKGNTGTTETLSTRFYQSSTVPNTFIVTLRRMITTAYWYTFLLLLLIRSRRLRWRAQDNAHYKAHCKSLPSKTLTSYRDAVGSITRWYDAWVKRSTDKLEVPGLSPFGLYYLAIICTCTRVIDRSSRVSYRLNVVLTSLADTRAGQSERCLPPAPIRTPEWPSRLSDQR